LNFVNLIKKQNILRLSSRGRPAFVSLAFLFSILILFSIFGGVQRSFLIDARTSFLQINFDGANAWRIGEATVCLPRLNPDRSAETELGSPCAGIFQLSEQVDGLVLSMPNDFSLILRAESEAHGTRLRIILPEGLRTEYPAGTEIVIGSSEWRQTGALLFSGHVVLGNVLGSGERHYLHSAVWSARQTSWSSWFRGGATDTVMTGDVMRGAQISVSKRTRDWFSIRNEVSPATVYGHITTATIPDGLPVFATNLVSEPGNTELHVDHYGLANTAKISPDFVATLRSSDLLLVIVAVLSLLAGAAQISRDVSLWGQATKQVSEKKTVSQVADKELK
jgi:hypothetical protein